MMKLRPIKVLLCAALLLGLQSCEKKMFFMIGTRSSSPVVPSVRGVRTKVPAITDGSLVSVQYGKFVMDGWSDNDYIDHSISSTVPQTDHHVINGAVVTYDSSAAIYKWTMDQTKYWINDVGMRFWCYAPQTINGTRTITNQAGGRSDMTFSYVLPTGGYTESSVPADATRQDDLLFSYNYERRSFDNDGEVSSYEGTRSDNRLDITFEHALSQVNFAICVEDGSFNLDLVNNILVISLANVASAGNCTYNGAASGDHFIWGTTATSTFTQAYTLDDIGYYAKNSSGSVMIDGVSKTFPDINTMRASQQSFMMIPHTLGQYATISATFRYEDTDGVMQSTTRTVSLADEVWKPGKYYTYRIVASTIGRDINIDITLADWGDANESIIV